MTGKDMVCVLIAYLLGGVCTGYYLVRARAKLDVRNQGSGGVGARNAGRVLGRSGFMATLFGDGLKGMLAVVLARRLGGSGLAVSLVLVAVVAGHVWPLPLRFRGGRGIATAIGAYLAYDPYLVLFLLGATGVLLVFRRGFVLSGLAAFLLLPLVAYALKLPTHAVAALAASSAIILFAHRGYLRQAVGEALPQREV